MHSQLEDWIQPVGSLLACRGVVLQISTPAIWLQLQLCLARGRHRNTSASSLLDLNLLWTHDLLSNGD